MNPKTRRPDKATYQKAMAILADTMKPWRPAELFRAAFTPVPGHEHPVGRESERFREHFAAFSREITKVGPWYALTRWLMPVLPFVIPDSLIAIPLSGETIRKAQRETLKRLDYMVVRNAQASKATRISAALEGFTVEQHVKQFFATRWPESYRPASNEGIWQKPVPDDFSLILDGRRFLVDVVGSDGKFPPRWRIRLGKMGGASLRIVAFYNESGIVMQGYTSGRADDLTLRPIERVIVRLNIQKDPACLEAFQDLILLRTP